MKTIWAACFVDGEWLCINSIPAFLRAPRECMEPLAADHESTLNILLTCVTLLVRNCTDGEKGWRSAEPV